MRASSREALVRQVRDLQLVDREDAHCGVVDDVEIEEIQPGIFELKAILVGPGVLADRLPGWLRPLVRLVAGSKRVRVDAQDVASVTSVVRLLFRADDRDLAQTENWLLAKMNP